MAFRLTCVLLLGIFQRTLRHKTEYWWHSLETVTRCNSQGFAGRELGHRQMECLAGMVQRSLLSIWLEGKVTYPISPTPEDLAIYMEDKGYVQDRSQFSPSELLGFLNEWVKDNLTESTQNCNTYFYEHWCDTQLRKACSKVKILVGQIQAKPVLEIGAIKRSITNFYRELDVFKLHE